MFSYRIAICRVVQFQFCGRTHVFIQIFQVLIFLYTISTMKSFVLLKKHLSLFGILRDNSRGKYYPLISSCVIFGFTVILFISTFWYFAFTANNFHERANSFYYLSSSLLMFTWFSIYLIQRMKYINLFNELDAIIERSR